MNEKWLLMAGLSVFVGTSGGCGGAGRPEARRVAGRT